MKQDTAQDVIISDKSTGKFVTSFKFVTQLQSKVLGKHLFEKGYNVTIKNNQTDEILYELKQK